MLWFCTLVVYKSYGSANLDISFRTTKFFQRKRKFLNNFTNTLTIWYFWFCKSQKVHKNRHQTFINTRQTR